MTILPLWNRNYNHLIFQAIIYTSFPENSSEPATNAELLHFGLREHKPVGCRKLHCFFSRCILPTAP